MQEKICERCGEEVKYRTQHLPMAWDLGSDPCYIVKFNLVDRSKYEEVLLVQHINLISTSALVKVGLGYNAGNRLYSDREPGDWREKKTKQDHIEAADRHLNAYIYSIKKNPIDEETGIPHLVLAAGRLMMALDEVYDEKD